MATGKQIVELAETKLGQQYVFGARVPLDNRAWSGPWDCAEYCSWVVYQAAKFIYGCTDDSEPPAIADPYTGSWKRDVLSLGIQISVGEAAVIKGAMLLRRSANSGHIAISNGDGDTTLEARGRLYGVVRYVISGRTWDYGVLVPGVEYDRTRAPSTYQSPFIVRNTPAGRFSGFAVTDVQRRLANLGLLGGAPTGVYDDKTEVAVRDYQISRGLTPDGELTTETAQQLGIDASQDRIQFTRSE